MKPSLAISILLAFQSSAAFSQATQVSPQPSPASVDPVMAKIQQATQTAGDSVARLRIEKWKTGTAQKAEMQKIADSVHRNINIAVPDLIKNVQASHGNVSTAFKLYHNLNVLFEYVNMLADSAVAVGTPEEFTSLSRNADALNSARQELSDYIEHAATMLEDKVRLAEAPPPPKAAPSPPPKIVIDDDAPQKKPATSKKKKATVPAPQPVSTPN